jgi:hypothetical protein
MNFFRFCSSPFRRLFAALFTVPIIFLIPEGVAKIDSASTESVSSDRVKAGEMLVKCLGQRTIDGSLKALYPVIDTEFLRAIGSPCLLAYTQVFQSDGLPRSNFEIWGLRSYLVPEGLAAWRWQPVGGRPFLIHRSLIRTSFPTQWNSLFTMRESGENEFEVLTRTGVVWRYRQGILAAIDVPGKGTYQIVCRGTYMETVTLEGAKTPEIEVQFDDNRRPIRLFACGQCVSVFEWNDEGFLLQWKTFEDKTFSFGYRDGLLAEIEYTGFPLIQVGWSENPGWRRGDSRWPLPIQLTKFGESRYDLLVERNGYVTHFTNPREGTAGEVCFNPLSNILTFKTNIGNRTFQIEAY